MLVIGVKVRGLKSLNDRLNLAHLLGLIGVHTKDKLGGRGGVVDSCFYKI